MVREVTVFLEIGAIFEVDECDFGVDGGGFSFFGEFDEGIMGFCEVKIDDIGSGSAFDTGDFECASNETSKAESGITWRVILIIG